MNPRAYIGRKPTVIYSTNPIQFAKIQRLIQTGAEHMKTQEFPDGFVLEVYVRPSMHIIINIDRYEGVQLGGASKSCFAQIMFEHVSLEEIMQRSIRGD